MFAWILIHVNWFLQSHQSDYLLFSPSIMFGGKQVKTAQVTFQKKVKKKYEYSAHKEEHMRDVYKSEDLRRHLDALEVAVRPYWTFTKHSRILDTSDSMCLSLKGYLPDIHHKSVMSFRKSNGRKEQMKRNEGRNSYNESTTSALWEHEEDNEDNQSSASEASEVDLMRRSQLGPGASKDDNKRKRGLPRKQEVTLSLEEEFPSTRKSVFSYLQWSCHKGQAEENTIQSSLEDILPLYFSIATLVSPPSLRLLTPEELTHVRFRQVFLLHFHLS